MSKRFGSIAYVYEDSEGVSPIGVPCEIEFEIAYVLTPGEPMVRYYPDGSGYPGSPDEVEFETPVPVRVRTEKGLLLRTDHAALIKWFGTIKDEDKMYEMACEDAKERD